MIKDQELSLIELAALAEERAVYTAFLSLHFVTLVDLPFVTRLRGGELNSALTDLIENETGNADIRAGARLMQEYLENTRDLDLPLLTEQLGVDRTRLYRGVAKGYGPPPPFEMVWSNKIKDYGALQIIASAYREVGLEPSPDMKERLDYISVEIDFLHELAVREAEAWKSVDIDRAVQLLVLQRDFLATHLGDWAPDFIEKALEFAETDFYRGHLIMLRGFLQSESQRLDLLADSFHDG